MIMTAKMIDANEALAYGLINYKTEQTELIDFGTTEVTDEASDELPGFGILAAGASLLFVSRRFRK